MTAVITGATGFLGGALARELLEQGTPVRVLARRPEAAEPLKQLGAEVHAGNLEDAASLCGLIEAGDVVYHCAARVDLSGPLRDFERTNVEGTQNLLDACRDNQPGRFVFVSSGAVYGAAALNERVSADRIPAEPLAYNFYGRTKRAAEQRVEAAAARDGFDYVILRLGFLYGVGNRPLLDHVEPLMRKGRYVLMGKGKNRIATLDIADAVAATIAVGTHPAAAGRTYDGASSEAVTQREFFAATAEALGCSTRFRDIRLSLARPLARVAEWTCGLLGRPAPLTRAMVDLLGADQQIDSSAMRDELGWEPKVSFAEGMQRMREWYAGEGARERGSQGARRE